MRRAPLPLAALAAGVLLLGGAPARAQLTVSPESLAVALAGGRAAATLTLTNTSGSALRYCLDFERPRERPPDEVAGASTCGEPGALLDTVTNRETGVYWDPHALAMTPDGRLFAAEEGGIGLTFELDAALNVVRSFAHPAVAELSPFHRTVGVTYNEDTHTLWWTNAEVNLFEVTRILLLEGTLDGVATGRRIELAVPPGLPPDDTGFPMGATYDPATKLFYYVDGLRDDLWAADTTGAVQPGYPVRLAAYPEAYLGSGLDVHGGSALGGAGGDPADVRLEVPVGLGAEFIFDRVVVTDPEGGDLRAETPLPPISALGLWGGYPDGNAVRSRVDPNGVLYAAYTGRDLDSIEVVVHGIAAIRPVPLAPPWLGLNEWSGTIEAGGSAEVVLRFGAGGRPPGVYRTVLVVEDTAGAVLLQVPLALEVLPDVAGEPGPDAPPSVSLAVVPNPSAGDAVVTLTLVAPGAVRLAVYDVLGRRVALLHEGVLGAGPHAFGLDGASLRPGLYAVRAEADGRVAARALTLTR